MCPISKTPLLAHTELTAKGFSALLDSAVDGIVIIDRQGNILNFNRAARMLFGYEEHEVINQNVKMLMPEPYHSEHDGYLDNYRTSGNARIIGTGRQVRAQKKDTTTFPIFLSVGQYQEGDHQYFIGTIQDLTKQVEAEELANEFRNRLSHADRVSTMGEMASGVAHELNQPLTAISSYVQACQRRLKLPEHDPEKILELLSKVEQQALRAGAIIDRIRALVKPHDMRRELANINLVVTEAMEMTRADAADRGVSMDLQLMPADADVVVDTIQIQQVVLNLIRNAVDSTEIAENIPGAVTISTQFNRPANTVEVAVADRGTGISQEVKDRLFHPFVTSKLKGTGLGLSISRSIVDAHGGELWVTEGDPGVTFTFSIPLAVTGDH